MFLDLSARTIIYLSLIFLISFNNCLWKILLTFLNSTFLSLVPPQVLKELPKTIRKRILTISFWKKISQSSKIEYDNSLKISSFKVRLVYENSSENENDKNEKKKRKRNMIWYSPPYSANTESKIGKIFF